MLYIVCKKFEKPTHANEILTTYNIKKINWITMILCYNEELSQYFIKSKVSLGYLRI